MFLHCLFLGGQISITTNGFESSLLSHLFYPFRTSSVVNMAIVTPSEKTKLASTFLFITLNVKLDNYCS